MRPFTLINVAMTADGKIATANRRVVSFGSHRDLEHLYELRATVDAVMSGARTVDREAVDLGPGPARFRQLRRSRGLAEYNLRVVVSGQGTVDPHATVFQRGFSPVLVLTSKQASPRRRQRLQRVAHEVIVLGERQVDLAAALDRLARVWNVRRLLCEGGGELNGAMLRAGLVDEVHLTICPQICGGRTAPTLADGPDLLSLAEAIPCRLKSATPCGDELFLVYSVSHARGKPQTPAWPAQTRQPADLTAGR